MLDTNVVLDWLVFREPSCAPLAQALAAGELRWIATCAMRLEMKNVLARRRFVAWAPDEALIWATWDALAHSCNAPVATPPRRLRCNDPDDQMFVDLALHQHATALLSSDRALLRLAGRARTLGLVISTPDAWLQHRRSGTVESTSLCRTQIRVCASRPPLT